MTWRTKEIHAGIRKGTLDIEARIKKNFIHGPVMNGLDHSLGSLLLR